MKSRHIAGFLLFCGDDIRSVHLRAACDLIFAGRGATDAAGIGDHHAERVVRIGWLAEQQGDVAAAGAAVGMETHEVPARGAAYDQLAVVAMALADIKRPVVWLVVTVGVVAKQPSVVPARIVVATAAVAGRAEQGALAADDGGFTSVSKCRHEVGLRDLQLVPAQQLPHGWYGHAGERCDDGEYHDLLDQGHAMLPARKLEVPEGCHGVASCVVREAHAKTLVPTSQ
jgi:hypothetical protein